MANGGWVVVDVALRPLRQLHRCSLVGVDPGYGSWDPRITNQFVCPPNRPRVNRCEGLETGSEARIEFRLVSPLAGVELPSRLDAKEGKPSPHRRLGTLKEGKNALTHHNCQHHQLLQSACRLDQK